MAFDGITLNSVMYELNTLVGGKVNHVFQPSTNNLIISIYNGKMYALNIDTTANNYRIHLTTHERQNPINAFNFCMLLRKYLIGSKIKKIYMNGLERICYIDFECFNEMNDLVVRTLVIELMGKYSNVILLNQNLHIIDALKKFDNNFDAVNSDLDVRNIMPGRKYIEPSSYKNDFTRITLDDFINLVSTSEYKTLDSAIPNLFVGISKLFIQSCIDTLTVSNTISNSSLKEIYYYMKSIIFHNSVDSIIKCIAFKDNYSVKLCKFCVSKEEPDKDLSQLASLRINFFIDDFYYSKIENEEFTSYRNGLLKILSGTLDKLTKKLNNINEKIISCNDMEKYKLYGELLISNIYKFADLNMNSPITEVVLENYYDNNNLIHIPIDQNKSISKNADKYFKKYNKLKNTLEVTKVQKDETTKELSYLESLVYELDNCHNVSEIDEIYSEISENILFNDISKKRFEKKSNFTKKKKGKIVDEMLLNYIKLKVDGFDVFIGKNNKQNDYLSMKIANDNDYWFHAKDIHGSHLILRCNGEMPKISTITKCAQLCAYFSKAKFSSHVPVDYTLAKYVKKPHGSVPGYVIYTNNKTIYVDPISKVTS